MPKQFRENISINSGVNDTSGLWFESLKATSGIETLGVDNNGNVVKTEIDFKERQFDVNQSGHGFAAMTPIYFDGTDWKQSDKDHPATHVVKESTDTDNFKAIGPVPKKIEGHGLTVGKTVYQDGDSLTTTKPAGDAHCVGQVYNDNEIFFWEHIDCRKDGCPTKPVTESDPHSADKEVEEIVVRIHEDVADPKARVTYHGDTRLFRPGGDEWDKWFGHRPCEFKNGAVVKYLNPDNFVEDEDGNEFKGNDKDAGDTMIEFPKRGLQITKKDKVVEIRFTKKGDSSEHGYKAHTKDGTTKDNFYIGTYEAAIVDNKLRSLDNYTITVDKKQSEFRTAAEKNGAGYQLYGWYQHIYIQAMYICKYKTTNSYEDFAKGYSSSENTGKTYAGFTKHEGMDYGSTNDKRSMKLFGIENLWGNTFTMFDGLHFGSDKKILVADHSFSSTGSGYTDTGLTGVGSGRIVEVHGTNDAGFLASKVEGSDYSQYYGGYGSAGANRMPVISYYWKAGKRATLTYLAYSSEDTKSTSYATRLAYV